MFPGLISDFTRLGDKNTNWRGDVGGTQACVPGELLEEVLCRLGKRRIRRVLDTIDQVISEGLGLVTRLRD